MDMPHFLDVQREAFDRLLQLESIADVRRDLGLERVFREIFPITDANENFSLEFISYSLGEPKYGVEECIERDMTYAAPLKARLRLIAFETIGEDSEKRPGEIVDGTSDVKVHARRPRHRCAGFGSIGRLSLIHI